MFVTKYKNHFRDIPLSRLENCLFKINYKYLIIYVMPLYLHVICVYSTVIFLFIKIVYKTIFLRIMAFYFENICI